MYSADLEYIGNQAIKHVPTAYCGEASAQVPAAVRKHSRKKLIKTIVVIKDLAYISCD